MGGFVLATQYWLVTSAGPMLVLLAAGLGVLWLPAGWLAHRLLSVPVTTCRVGAALVVVPSAWVAAEAVRSWQSLGGPWALLGASQWSQPVTLASASLGGVWLTSFLLVATNTAIASVLVCRATGGRLVALGCVIGCAGLGPASYLLLENIRFDKRETSKNDDDRRALAKQLVELVGTGGVFVSDGFGVVHRKQASVYDIATLLPHYAGTLVADEMRVLEQLTSSTQRPYAVVLGGSKVSDKLGVIESLATKADSIVIGGGMCFTFLAAQGFSVGTSLLEDDMIEVCRGLLETYHDVLRLPVDLVVTEKFAADSPPQTVDVGAVPNGLMGLDIGPGSIKRFSTLLSNAGTIFWNGPMGVFEFPAYAAGTRGVAEAIVAATGKGAFSVVGGGDSAAAVRAMNIPEGAFSHISTGGGASLEYLEGKTLPGIEVLSREQPTGGVL